MKFGDYMQESVCKCGRCQHELCTKRVPIFSGMNNEEFEQIASLIMRKKYSKGEMLLMEGDHLSSLVIINRGKIKAFRFTPDGKEQILYIFSEGDFFGEMSLLSSSEVAYSAEALEDTSVCLIMKKDFQGLLREYPEISLKIMEQLCIRLEKMEGMVERMSSKDVDFRVNMVLLEFSKKYGKPHQKGRLVDLPLSREGIANYIGITRETVSRKLSHLQEEGIIELVGNKKVIIMDEEALKQNG